MIHEYDVALSFAGEDREYVDQVARHLQGSGIRVFYDAFEEANLWGKNLYDYLCEIYWKRARYTIIFISQSYESKIWTTHERKSAQARAFTERQEYILPARFDDTPIPGMTETVGYISLNGKTPEEFCELVIRKIGVSVGSRFDDAVPADFSKSLSAEVKISAGGQIAVANKSYIIAIATNVVAITALVMVFLTSQVNLDKVLNTWDSYRGLLEMLVFNFGTLHSILVWTIFLTIYGILYSYERYHGKSADIVETTRNHYFNLWVFGFSAFAIHLLSLATGKLLQISSIVSPAALQVFDFWRWVSVVFLTVYGVFWLAWGRVSINGYWSPDIHKYKTVNIVTHGAYSVVRHPVYGGQIVLMLSIFLACDNFALFWLPLMTWLQSHRRAQVEERMLTKYSNSDYKKYREDTKRRFFWIPFAS